MATFRIVICALVLLLAAAQQSACGAEKGTYLYVHDSSAQKVYAFRLHPEIEQLVRLVGSPYGGTDSSTDCWGFCQTLTYVKKKKMLVGSGGRGLTPWKVHNDGKLSRVSGSPFGPPDSEQDFRGVTSVRIGKRTFVYTVSGGGILWGYEFGKSGKLKPISNIGIEAFAGYEASGVTSIGRVVIVAAKGDDVDPASIASFRIHRNGTAGIGFFGNTPNSLIEVNPIGDTYNVTIDPRRTKYVYMPDSGSYNTYGFRLDRSKGTLRPMAVGKPGVGIRASDGMSLSKRNVGFVLSRHPNGQGVDDIQALGRGHKGKRTILGGRQSSGIAGILDAHAIDPSGQFLAVASSGVTVRLFRISNDTGQIEQVDDESLSAVRVTGMAFVRR